MTAAALVAEVQRHGVELIPTPEGRLRIRPASKMPPALLGALRERKAEVLALITADPPATSLAEDAKVALEIRVCAFRRQIEIWKADRRPGVPLLTLPDAPLPAAGRCISCGKSASDGWRCSACLVALGIALDASSAPTEGESAGS
jgi:hypothetical protein